MATPAALTSPRKPKPNQREKQSPSSRRLLFSPFFISFYFFSKSPSVTTGHSCRRILTSAFLGAQSFCLGLTLDSPLSNDSSDCQLVFFFRWSHPPSFDVSAAAAGQTGGRAAVLPSSAAAAAHSLYCNQCESEETVRSLKGTTRTRARTHTAFVFTL